ncbi:SIR2 family protein [Gordonia zhaorongruii]|uniref:SIR2 family protein n=1 Tax=Gordonia zhaorongruii TaxID=2597659 RepID=UPI001404F6D9|nr:SIR2 family protein [Gordonia zhaorongruii]
MAGVASDELVELIADQIAVCIAGKEMHAIAEILSASEVPAFSRLFRHVLRTTERVDVITTNYDRLLEVQAARVGIGVDSIFYGHTVGKFDPVQSSKTMLRPENQVGHRRTTSIRTIPHVRLSKPHGSLDWFTYNDEHFRSDLAIPGARRIVAPGGDKYRQGYDVPFDQQRERANAAIDAAAALLFVGYGFNDDHLQTHIQERIRKVPSVILSHTITESAREYLATSPSAIGMEADSANDAYTRVLKGEGKTVLDSPIWDLNRFVKEVLGK